MKMSKTASFGYRLLTGAALACPLLATPALGQAVEPSPSSEAAPTEGAGGEILVTATRNATSLSRTPISVAVSSQEQLQTRGIKDLNDLVRQTPGVAITRDHFGAATIAIRGIASEAGAATTGIYLDDVPLQVRQLSGSAGAFIPELFDVDRTEILRGPQGTLFGAGSQGGTLRFIQPNPSFVEWSGRARAEVSQIESGGTGYELGVAIGGPIVEDKLAFRASGVIRRQAGFIDAVRGQVIVDIPAASGSPSDIRDAVVAAAENGPFDGIQLADSELVESNSNWVLAKSGRFALSARPTEDLTITGSLNYQVRDINNALSTIATGISDPSNGIHRAIVYTAGSSAQLRNDPNVPGHVGNGQPFLTDITDVPTLNEGREEAWVPYLNVDLNVGDVNVVSTTSWLVRDFRQVVDQTFPYAAAYLGMVAPVVGEKGALMANDTQRSFTQEVRVQNDPLNPLHVLAGIYYSNSRQTSYTDIPVNFTELAPRYFGFIDADTGPFPGTSAFLNTFGTPSLPNSVMYLADLSTHDRQYAGFGQLAYKPVEDLTIAVSARYAYNELTATYFTDGPENNVNGPFGSDCPVAGGCTVGAAPFVPAYGRGTIENNEGAFTPKLNISYQASPRDLFYATVSKGFRVGGAQIAVPNVCNADLALFGYSESPTAYDSDTVWNYEIGSKNRVFDGMLSIDANAYVIKWKDIQTRVQLPGCGYSVIDNLGEATSKGFDLALALTPTPQLTLSATMGYNVTKFDVATPVFDKGDYVPGTGSPFVAFVAADFTQPDGANEAYAHVDMTYGSKPRVTGLYNPTSPNYSPYNVPSDGYTLVSARIGYRFDAFDVSMFANNLLDFSGQQNIRYYPGNAVFEGAYLQPRTFGLTASARF